MLLPLNVLAVRKYRIAFFFLQVENFDLQIIFLLDVVDHLVGLRFDVLSQIDGTTKEKDADLLALVEVW